MKLEPEYRIDDVDLDKMMQEHSRRRVRTTTLVLCMGIVAGLSFAAAMVSIIVTLFHLWPR